jgi:glycine oxidase
VVIVGGGVIGLAVAWVLARRGARVRVFERARPARAASRAAGGMLSPLGEASSPGPFLDLARRSLALYPDFVAKLPGGAEAVGLRRCGKLVVTFANRDVAELRERAGWLAASDPGVRVLEGAAARNVEPGLAAGVLAGLHLPSDGVVDNRRLGQSLARAVVQAGVEVRTDCEVRGLRQGDGGVTGITLADGTAIHADGVVVAAGAWSGALGGLPRPLPVRPVRGQMLALAPDEQPLRGVVGAPGAYLIPRRTAEGERVIVGATQEEVGFREGTDPAALDALRNAAVRAVPILARAPVASHWWGFRPGTPDDLPVLGADPEVPGLAWATGHFRNGILLAPVTAELVSQAVLDGDAPGLEPFRADRF